MTTNRLLFRAWNIDSKSFIYFDLSEPDEFLFGRHGYLENNLPDPKWEQYIGGKDYKGINIYVNDIVELEYLEELNPKKRKKRLALIEFAQTNLAFRACREDGFIANTNNFEKYKTKIVGNIYENPELYQLLQAQIKAQRTLVKEKNTKIQSERKKKKGIS